MNGAAVGAGAQLGAPAAVCVPSDTGHLTYQIPTQSPGSPGLSTYQQWITGGQSSGGTQNAAMISTDVKAYGAAFAVHEDMTIDRVGVTVVSVGPASIDAKIAVYRWTGDIAALDLVAESSTFPLTATGLQLGTIAADLKCGEAYVIAISTSVPMTGNMQFASVGTYLAVPRTLTTNRAERVDLMTTGPLTFPAVSQIVYSDVITPLFRMRIAA